MKSRDNTVKVYDMRIKSGKGAVLTDTKGREYIDMLAGVAVNLFGYNDKAVNAAINNQVKKYIHSSRWFYNAEQEKMTEALRKITFGANAYYVNSGAEATEVAIKFARKWGRLNKKGAYKIVSMKNSFHGRTIAALTATGQKKFHKYLKPLPAGFVHAKFNDIKSVEKKIDAKTAAVLVEPIQAEGGVNMPKDNFLKKLRKVCDRKNVLLIFDEIQTGLGRTGKPFAYQSFGVTPDIMTLGKGLGGGLPLSAVVISGKLAKVFGLGDHGTTMGGNPVACAAGNVVLSRISKKPLLNAVKTKGLYMVKKLKEAAKVLPRIKEVRGLGLIIGIEIDGGAPEIAAKALKKGLIINPAKPNVLRLVPPLIISKKEIDRAVKIISEVLG